MQWLQAVVFSVGIALAILGWFLDRISHFDWLMRLLAPQFFHGTKAIDELTSSASKRILPANPGFCVILQLWPSLLSHTSVATIGRSTAYLDIGSDELAVSDFDLVAYDASGKEIPSRWTAKTVRDIFTKELEKRFFWFSGAIFFLGIAISLVTGLIEFFAV